MYTSKTKCNNLQILLKAYLTYYFTLISTEIVQHTNAYFTTVLLEGWNCKYWIFTKFFINTRKSFFVLPQKSTQKTRILVAVVVKAPYTTTKQQHKYTKWKKKDKCKIQILSFLTYASKNYIKNYLIAQFILFWMTFLLTFELVILIRLEEYSGLTICTHHTQSNLFRIWVKISCVDGL